mgnify:CR=1 FL=1
MIFIIIFYLIFPRAEFNFRVFDTPMSTLGIPDTINLGSFSEFSNSEEEIFKANKEKIKEIKKIGKSKQNHLIHF